MSAVAVAVVVAAAGSALPLISRMHFILWPCDGCMNGIMMMCICCCADGEMENYNNNENKVYELDSSYFVFVLIFMSHARLAMCCKIICFRVD